MAADEMIVVRGACKQYTSEWNVTKMFSPRDKPHLALAGLDMTVPKGSIYALLGPSGCGKTTLLSCIIGRRCMNAGEIKLGVTSSKKIGYMPQEVALQIDLSIEENISFYSHLFNLTSQQMEAKRNNLYQFLEIPHHHRLVSQISGGQQRRVSLFIALLHDPELLILDEPTVGLDPCLSHKIWEFFIRLSTEEGRTVLITTHYIEEARKADKVGLMRKGVILEEGNPGELMSRYGVESMDELFLKITMQHSTDGANQPKCIPKLTSSVKSPLRSNSAVSLHRLKSGVMNGYYWTKRNLSMMFILLLIPMIDCACFEAAVGRYPSDMRVGLINDELKMGRESCRNWARSCDKENFSVPLSCGFLEEIERHGMKFVDYEIIEDAKHDSYRNQIWGYIHVPANYSWALLNRLEMNIDTSDNQLEMSLIDVQLDKSYQVFYSHLRFNMFRSYFKFLERLYEGCGWNVAAAGLPIHHHDPVYGEEDISFSDFSMPAIVVTTAYILPVIYVVGVIVSEKKLGLWERYFVSGMNMGEIIISHVILTLILLFLQVLAMVLLIFVIENNLLMGSLGLYIVLTYLVGVTGVTFGVLIAIASDEEYDATYFSMGQLLLYSVLCGLMWPVQGMHPVLQSISWYLPLTLPGESLRSISIRGWGLSEPLVYKGFFITIAWIIIHILATYGIIKSRKIS